MDTHLNGDDWKWFKKWGLILLGAILVLWIGNAVLLLWLIGSPECRGQFGDMFGGVNALFSGLAFGGVAVALYFQGRELRHQASDAKETREVLKRTAAAQERAADANLLKQVYDYVIETHDERMRLFENADKIQRVKDLKSLLQFEKDTKSLADDLNAATNCYHYIGFLMYSGVLTHRMDDFLQEGSHVVADLFDLVYHVLQQQRQAPGRSIKRKQFFDWLAIRAKAFDENHPLPIDHSSEPESHG